MCTYDTNAYALFFTYTRLFRQKHHDNVLLGGITK